MEKTFIEMKLFQVSRIIITRSSDFDARAKWTEQFDWMIDKMYRMRKTFKKYI